MCMGFLLTKKIRFGVKKNYSWFFDEKISDKIYCAKVLMKRIKVRKMILENG